MHASLPPTIDREHDVEASSGSVDSEVMKLLEEKESDQIEKLKNM